MKSRITLILYLFFSFACAADFRIWESSDGSRIWEGEFETMNGDMVVIRGQDGKRNEYRPSDLCNADLEYLEKVIPPSLNLDVSRSTDSGSSRRSESVTCTVTIKKSDTRKYKGELTAVLVLMAEEIKTGAYSKAGSSREYVFRLPDKHGIPVEFKSDSISFLKRSNSSGRAYAGYVLVVWDRFGNPVAVKSNRDSFAEKATKIARPKPKYK